MGVKSTKYISRPDAEQRYAELWAEMSAKEIEATFRAMAAMMSDKELEDALERASDQAHDGEGFENYIIGEERWAS